MVKDGWFLVRNSARSDRGYVVSFVSNGTLLHSTIHVEANGECWSPTDQSEEKEPARFSSLQQFVRQHSKSAYGFPTRLLQPAHRRADPSRSSGDAFNTVIDDVQV